MRDSEQLYEEYLAKCTERNEHYTGMQRSQTGMQRSLRPAVRDSEQLYQEYLAKFTAGFGWI